MPDDSLHPETRSAHAELAAWADTQPPEVKSAAYNVVRMLWMIQNNQPTRQQELDELARYSKILAEAKAKAGG